jgi:hypothetical protein
MAKICRNFTLLSLICQSKYQNIKISKYTPAPLIGPAGIADAGKAATRQKTDFF